VCLSGFFFFDSGQSSRLLLLYRASRLAKKSFGIFIFDLPYLIGITGGSFSSIRRISIPDIRRTRGGPLRRTMQDQSRQCSRVIRHNGLHPVWLTPA
jgi:hypothetical protein